MNIIQKTKLFSFDPKEKRLLLPALIAVYYIFQFYIVALSRISYPYELEWMEGAIVDHVLRIMQNLPLYGPPSMEFTPFIYTPLYYYVSAWMSEFVGEGFVALRIVSLLSSTGCLILLGMIILRETKSTFSSIIAAGIFAASYHKLDSWFDVARIDMLWLFLILALIWFARKKLTWISGVILVLISLLIFFTKQSGILITLLILSHHIYRNRMKGLVLIGSVLAAIFLTSLIMNYQTDGWFTLYTFKLPSEHRYFLKQAFYFFGPDIGPLWPILLVSAFIVVKWKRFWFKNYSFFLFVFVAMFAGSLLSRMHVGGYPNVLIPFYAGVSVFGGLVAGWKREPVRQSRPQAYISSFGPPLALVLTFILLFYNPSEVIPDSQNKTAGDDFMHRIGSFEGNVLVWSHGYYSTLLGKSPHAHKMAVYDVLRAELDPSIKHALYSNMQQAFELGHYKYVVMDASWFVPEARSLVEKYYYKIDDFIFETEAFFSPTGYDTRPSSIWVHKNP